MLGTTRSFGADPVTLTMARNADMLTFDPASTEDDPSIFVELQVYDRLVKLAASNTGVEPELATSWKVAPDGLTATFTLRAGREVLGRSPLTAEDVVFSLTRAIDQKGSWGFLFSPVKSVTKVDDKTVRLNMSEPFAPLLPALSTFAASIYSKANFEKWGKDAGQHPLGTGAFMLDSWQKGVPAGAHQEPPLLAARQAEGRPDRDARSSATTTRASCSSSPARWTSSTSCPPTRSSRS